MNAFDFAKQIILPEFLEMLSTNKDKWQ